MFKKLLTTRSLCVSAIIAALYAALTLLLAPLSYGPVQLRVSEALTLLPVLLPQSIPGLFVGCMLANLMGACPWQDIVFGSLATLLAALGTWTFRKNRLLAAACPVIANGLIVGLVVSLSYNQPIAFTMLTVALGEAAAVSLGLLMIRLIERANIDLNRLH